MEEKLKNQLTNAEQQNLELRKKLRAVEQANDDMERRERLFTKYGNFKKVFLESMLSNCMT